MSFFPADGLFDFGETGDFFLGDFGTIFSLDSFNPFVDSVVVGFSLESLLSFSELDVSGLNSCFSS